MEGREFETPAAIGGCLQIKSWSVHDKKKRLQILVLTSPAMSIQWRRRLLAQSERGIASQLSFYKEAADERGNPLRSLNS
jgi:hypothetical protein